jgi:hypothetical protein
MDCTLPLSNDSHWYWGLSWPWLVDKIPAPVCLSSLVISSSNLPPKLLSPPRPVPVGSPPWIMKSLIMRWNLRVGRHACEHCQCIRMEPQLASVRACLHACVHACMEAVPVHQGSIPASGALREKWRESSLHLARRYPPWQWQEHPSAAAVGSMTKALAPHAAETTASIHTSLASPLCRRKSPSGQAC